MIEIPPPKGHDRRAAPGQTVIDLVRARQRHEGKKAFFREWHFDRERYRLVLCTNGRVYLDVGANNADRVQLDLNDTDLEQIISDLQRMRVAQRQLHAHRRGAHLWIARPHPTQPGWLMVRHNDQDTAFKPVRCGARKPTRSGHVPPMPKCSGCAKPFDVGEQAFEAQKAIFGHFGERARICKGCTQPPREGLVEIDGGAE